MGTAEGSTRLSQGGMSDGGDRALVIDAIAVLFVSFGIVFAADQLVFMTLLVPAVIVLRFVAWSRLVVAERGPVSVEVAFFGLCTLLGAFNDWSSVDRYRIYEYDVPAFWPDVSSIPFWMLLFWGMILRSLATLSRWERLRPPAAGRDRVFLGARSVNSPAVRVACMLVLVLVTRQFVYRQYGHPVFSWLPFAVALLVYAAVFRPGPGERRLALLFLVVGPVIEILYIQLGGLHRYHLGWLGGVPLWIALWWVLAVLIWADLSPRLHGLIGRVAS